MKPKDLKAAFAWEDRRPLIEDRIFHVPAHYEKHHEFDFPGWSALFGNDNPVCIEYCTGNGAWIEQRALQYPDKNWVAVEMRYDRVRKIWSKIKNGELPNLIVVCGEAWTFTHHYVPTASVEEVYINFPDPWPKEKHEKHRLMKPRFLDELARALKPGKTVTFVSDDPDYVTNTREVFQEHPRFTTLSVRNDDPTYGTSWFETLWRRKGKDITYLNFMAATPLDASETSSLKWDADGELFALELGLTDELIADEARLMALELALQEFSKQFEQAPAILGTYREEWLETLIHLASHIQGTPYVCVDTNAIPDAQSYLRLLGTLRCTSLVPLPHGKWAQTFPDALSHKPTLGVLLPEEGNFPIPDAPFRLIPEQLLTHLWDGLDTLLIDPESITPLCARKLRGFEAAGGEVKKNIPSPALRQ